jgi:hypothetical protein
MAAVTSIIAAAGLATSIGATAYGVVAQKQSIKAQEKAENARQKAANLDSLRRQRAVVRESQQQRALAVANATAQGAEGSSGLAGALGGISGQANTNIVGIEQQRQLGNEVFAANRAGFRASSAGATAEGLASLGGAFMKNAGTIASIGQYAYNQL